ncbi:hypothetical protein LIER_43127 [Lithospermum erythrorhizon]|uniref:Uncharacterized protein n=1 Tax=Lithospermum erythrorhizon TaxID=34254 RepID=A0AAV3PIE8_LITER
MCQKHNCSKAFIPPQKIKICRGVKITCPSSSPPTHVRPVVALLAARAALGRAGAAHKALLPILDQREMQRVAKLGPGPQAAHEVAFASLVLADGNLALHQRTLKLEEELIKKHIRVDELEKEIQELRLQADAASQFPWEWAPLAQNLKKIEEERDVARQAALSTRREREGLRRAYCQDSPLRCRRAGVSILLDSVLHYHDQVPSLLALAEEYMRRYLAGWLDNTATLPPVSASLPSPYSLGFFISFNFL